MRSVGAGTDSSPVIPSGPIFMAHLNFGGHFGVYDKVSIAG